MPKHAVSFRERSSVIVIFVKSKYCSWNQDFPFILQETTAKLMITGSLCKTCGSSTHVSCYRPFWALIFLKRRFHSSLSPACLLHPLIPMIYNVPLWTWSSHLLLGRPIDLLSRNFILQCCFIGPFRF